MTTEEAIALLGVKKSTLYTYVSRGWVQRIKAPTGRRMWYSREDVERLKTRRDARAGHAATAASALQWGEPVLTSSITEIRDGVLRYRGRDVLDLIDEGVSFEEVAELLWDTPNSPRSPRSPWPTASPRTPALTTRAMLRQVEDAANTDDERVLFTPSKERQRARALLAVLSGGGRGEQRRGVARAVCSGLGETRDEAISAIDRALVLCADHELNASTFVARITASTGADLYACLSAALCALSGPRHGGACARVAAMLNDHDSPASARAHTLKMLARGERPPGFVHPLYPKGDPRTPSFLRDAEILAPHSTHLHISLAVAETMQQSGVGGARLDFGLVTLIRALGWPPEAATYLFALGRVAGWVAHVIEQRKNPHILRPRALYRSQ